MHVNNNALIVEKLPLIVDGSYKCGTEDSLSCGIAIMPKFNI